MKTVKNITLFISIILFVGLFRSAGSCTAQSAEPLVPGVYSLEANLSCYVNAMGGVEFGAPLLTAAELTVAADGQETITMRFTKSSVTIYSVTCDTFIDAAPSYVTEDRGVKNGTIGYYDKNGVLQTEGVAYTFSEDTALNASNEAVHYVDSITFPADSRRETYAMTLYINSNVMGVQFTQSNELATAATYSATLTVNWSSVEVGAAATETSGAAAQPETQTQTAVDVEEMDGLNLYKADDTEAADGAAAVSQRAYLNISVLIALGSVGAGMLTAGIALLVCGKKRSPAFPDTNRKEEKIA